MSNLISITAALLVGTLIICSCPSSAQEPVTDLTNSPAFDHTIRSYLSFEVPVMTVADLKKDLDEFVLLDTRSIEEYEVSHIRGARFVGYKSFDAETLGDIAKDKTIVVYCSIGYRSEKIGEKLQRLGYMNVFNLYGSIFEWVNDDNPIFDIHGNETQLLHTYNRAWSKWVVNEAVQKTW
ncbi:MAG: rhodanese-like domain-containing protein [Saprospiraceae bacterium]|nr:rhodanese-like domain-containing protein [Saprospiraceae bacterium]